jgi:biopolymer transport protein ExbB
MKPYILIAAALISLGAPSHAQPRTDISRTPDGALERNAAPPTSPGGLSAQPNNLPPSLKQAPVALPELSAWTMFRSADLLVKAVMVSLAFASVISWTIFLAKSVTLKFAQWRLRRSLARISAARTLPEAQLMLAQRRGVLASLLAAATHEIRLSAGTATEDGIRERAASRFSDIVRTETRIVRQGMVMLATIGATAPFVGLFGTVWGIMNSFIGISKSQTTNLAVVAPGIAEALLATACGLAAAVPAVIFYNQLTRTMRGYLDLVRGASGAAARFLSRDLDHTRGRVDVRAAE